MMPKVSVLLPVFNGARQVGRAIDSILNQTYENFELIVIDDGSIDDTSNVLNKYNDPRVRVFRQKNVGLTSTLIKAISLANGEYIARQDHDDYSHPDRLKLQVAFLEENLDVSLVGAGAKILVSGLSTGRYLSFPCVDTELRWRLIFFNPFVHSSVMFRKCSYLEAGGYRADSDSQPEDYDLWSRMARVGHLANLPQILVDYEEAPGSLCRATPEKFRLQVANLRAKNLSFYSGVPKDQRCKKFGLVMSGNAYDYKIEATFFSIVSLLKSAYAAIGMKGLPYFSASFLKFVFFYITYKSGLEHQLDVARLVKAKIFGFFN